MIKNDKFNINFLIRKTTLLLVLFFTFTHSATAQKENDLTKEKLKGKVKSYTDFFFELIDNKEAIQKGETEKKPENIVRFTFNEDGFVTEQIEYKLDGSLVVKFTYTYDDRNNRIEESEFNKVKNNDLEFIARNASTFF